MKLLYHCELGNLIMLNCDIYTYLQDKMKEDKMFVKRWKDKQFSLVSDDLQKVYWKKKIQLIKEKDFNQ